jgi:hypothetical protein
MYKFIKWVIITIPLFFISGLIVAIFSSTNYYNNNLSESNELIGYFYKYLSILLLVFILYIIPLAVIGFFKLIFESRWNKTKGKLSYYLFKCSSNLFKVNAILIPIIFFLWLLISNSFLDTDGVGVGLFAAAIALFFGIFFIIVQIVTIVYSIEKNPFSLVSDTSTHSLYPESNIPIKKPSIKNVIIKSSLIIFILYLFSLMPVPSFILSRTQVYKQLVEVEKEEQDSLLIEKCLDYSMDVSEKNDCITNIAIDLKRPDLCEYSNGSAYSDSGDYFKFRSLCMQNYANVFSDFDLCKGLKGEGYLKGRDFFSKDCE